MDWTEQKGGFASPNYPATAAATAAATWALTYLTVTDFGVAVSVGGEDAPQRGDAGGVLEGGVGWEGAVEVSLDLLRGQAALAHRLLHQFAVVTLVGLQLRSRICNKRDNDLLN